MSYRWQEISLGRSYKFLFQLYPNAKDMRNLFTSLKQSEQDTPLSGHSSGHHGILLPGELCQVVLLLLLLTTTGHHPSWRGEARVSVWLPQTNLIDLSTWPGGRVCQVRWVILGGRREDWLLHLLEQRLLLHVLHAQALLHEKSLVGHLRHQGLRHLGHQVARIDPAHIHSLLTHFTWPFYRLVGKRLRYETMTLLSLRRPSTDWGLSESHGCCWTQSSSALLQIILKPDSFSHKLFIFYKNPGYHWVFC